MVGLGTTNYLYDGAKAIEEVDNSGNVLARYAQGKSVDEPLAQLRSETTTYYQQDGLGSVTSLSNSAGAISETYTYDSYGKPTVLTGTLVNPFQYTGREFDLDTGIYYYRARYFDPNAGRFINGDPIQFVGGVNFYKYSQNSPVVLADPTGYQACSAAQWAQSPNACTGATDPGAPYQGSDGLWYNVPNWTPPPPVVPPDMASSTASSASIAAPPSQGSCGCGHGENAPPEHDIEKMFNVFTRITHPLELTAVNASIFLASGIHFVAGGALIAGGCLEPTPFEPVTCAAGGLGGGIAFGEGAGFGTLGVWYFKNVTVPAFKGAECE